MRTQTQKTQDSAKADPITSSRSSTPPYSYPVLQLQQQLGNQTVQRLLQSKHLQAKLTIGQTDDKYEQEADRVADQIMRMPDPTTTEQSHNNLTTQKPVIQRLCPECEEALQRQPTEEIEEEEEEKLLQAKEMPSQTPEVSNEVESTINNLRGGGQALSPSDRSFFESRFGQDFSQVRIHTDAKAAGTAKAVNARAFTLGQDVVFGAGEYSSNTASGRKLLAHELAHVVQQRGRHDDVIHRQEGPQTFAGAVPGTEPLEPDLVSRNRYIEQEMLNEAEIFYASGDLRWFFTYAHAKITQQINNNISLFQRPNALLRLNIHFAEEFMRAIYGQPHEQWQRAFRACQALQRGSAETALLVGETEFCGAAMANVHINIDLSAALREVGCIPPADYGNMLVLVNRGSLAALARLRGRVLGSAEAMIQHVVAPMIDLEVKAWRNAAYSSVCNVSVPEVGPGFSRGIP